MIKLDKFMQTARTHGFWANEKLSGPPTTVTAAVQKTMGGINRGGNT